MTKNDPKTVGISELLKLNFKVEKHDSPTSIMSVFVGDINIKRYFKKSLEVRKVVMPNKIVFSAFVVVVEVEEVGTKHTSTKKKFKMEDFFS